MKEDRQKLILVYYLDNLKITLNVRRINLAKFWLEYCTYGIALTDGHSLSITTDTSAGWTKPRAIYSISAFNTSHMYDSLMDEKQNNTILDFYPVSISVK